MSGRVGDLLAEADCLTKTRHKMGDRIEALHAKAARLCSHPKNQIRRWYDSGHGAPWAICLKCGYAEEGWGVGHWKLPDPFHFDERVDISFDELMEHRRFFRSQRMIVHEKIHMKCHGQPRDMEKCESCARD